MIPTAAAMKVKVIGFYGQPLGAEGLEYVEKLLDAVSKAWTTWQSSLKFGLNKVTGAGVGAFSGAGLGGMMTGGSFTMAPVIYKKGSPEQIAFGKGLADALAAKFAAFPATYGITTMQYVGTSGASPTAPGPVQAPNVPIAMIAAGRGQNPSGIADMWKLALTPPAFDLNNPGCKSGKLIDAIGKTIESEFQLTWLATAMLMGNKLTATGAPGGVVSAMPTGMDGIVS